MIEEPKKNVHILVPKGFQNRELLQAERGLSHDASDTPANGVCVKCKGTGGVFHHLALKDPEIVDGRIVNCKPELSWFKCKCYMGQRWRRFHPLNVRVLLLPKWEKEIRDALEQEKARLIRESGGNYNPHTDTFLRDTGYKPEQRDKLLSLDDIVRESFRKKGDEHLLGG